MFRGIDVSRWNGKIDWEMVKESGVNFAMIRASYGYDDIEFINKGYDECFVENYEGAKKAGLAVGAYHYSYARNLNEAEKEVRHFLKVIGSRTFEFPLVMDIEDENTQGRLKGEKLTDIADRFLTTLENEGKYAMIYASKNWLKNYLNMDRLGKYDVWLAEWTPEPSYDGNYGIWQYSSRGQVKGIQGEVDLNYAYKDYRDLINKNGLNGFSKQITRSDEGYKIVVYSNLEDEPAAKTMARSLKLPLLYTDEFIENAIHVGYTDLKFKKKIFGKTKYDTVEEVIKYIKIKI